MFSEFVTYIRNTLGLYLCYAILGENVVQNVFLTAEIFNL